MSLANFIQKDTTDGDTEFKLGNIDFDLSNIECENVEISHSLKAPEITKINNNIEDLKTEISSMKTDIQIFKADVIELINTITLALNINTENKKITTTYDFEIRGNLIQG